MVFSENEVESFNFLGTIVENADWMSKKEKTKLITLHKVATKDIKRIQKGGKKRKRSKSGGKKDTGEPCDNGSECNSGICSDYDDSRGVKICQPPSSGETKEETVSPQIALQELVRTAVDVIGNITPQVTPEELHERGVTQATQENATTINNLATNVRNLLVMVNQNPDQIGLLTGVATTQQVVQTGNERMFNTMVASRERQLEREHQLAMAHLAAASRFGSERMGAAERLRRAEIDSTAATNQLQIAAGERKHAVENIDRTSAANFRLGTTVVLSALTVFLAYLAHGSTNAFFGIFHTIHDTASTPLPQIPHLPLEGLNRIWWAMGALINVLPSIINWTTSMFSFFLGFVTQILSSLAAMGTWGPVIAIVLSGMIIIMTIHILLRVGNFSLMIPGIYLRLGMGDQQPQQPQQQPQPLMLPQANPLPVIRDVFEGVRGGLQRGQPIRPALQNADMGFQSLVDMATSNAPPQANVDPLLGNGPPQPLLANVDPLLGNGQPQPLLANASAASPSVPPAPITQQQPEEKQREGGRKKKRRTYRKSKKGKKTKKKKKIARRQSQRKKHRKKSRR